MKQKVQLDKIVELIRSCCGFEVPAPQNMDLYGWDVFSYVYENTDKDYLVTFYTVVLRALQSSSVDYKHHAMCIVIRSLQRSFLYTIPMDRDSLRDTVSRLTVLVMHGCYRALLLLNPVLDYMDSNIRNLLLSRPPKQLYNLTADIDSALLKALSAFMQSQNAKNRSSPFYCLYPSLSLTFSTNKHCYLRRYCKL